MVWLMMAGGVAGILLGRFFRVHVLIPATMLIMVPAFYLGHEQGFATGATAFVASAVVMQVTYFTSLLICLLTENLSVLDQVQSEASPPLPEAQTALLPNS